MENNELRKTACTFLNEWTVQRTDLLMAELPQKNQEYQNLIKENNEILNVLDQIAAVNQSVAKLLQKLDSNSGKKLAIETEYIYEQGFKDGLGFINVLKGEAQ